ncbi:hypothetical protein [Erwinia sp. V71]|uniref:hypothetical protein n=1 Tax=Erwinia sp. V71 TaxID=3369424 RepID=UPI003F5FDEA9
MIIACLHAADSNIAVLSQSLAQLAWPQVTLRHDVVAELLAEAELAGGLTPAIIDATRERISQLCQLADAVIITCTTLGTAAEGGRFTKPVIRLDAALADEALRHSQHLLVLCTAPTTLASTQAMFQQRLRQAQRLQVVCVPDAWTQFKAGEIAACHRTIADFALTALAQDPTIDGLVLAQSSMSGAAALIEGVKVLTGPEASLRSAMALVHHP